MEKLKASARRVQFVAQGVPVGRYVLSTELVKSVGAARRYARTGSC